MQYVAVAVVALYLDRGLLEEDLNRQLLPAIEAPSPARWLEAAGLLARQFVGETATDWRDEVARSLLQPLTGADSLAHCEALVRRQAPSAAQGESRSLLGFLQSLVAFHPIWITPERIPGGVASELATSLGDALDEVLGALSVLADTELLHVQQVSVGRDGSFEPHVAVLSGLTVSGRSLSVDQRPTPGELHLGRRKSNRFLARVSPLLIFDTCEPGGMVPQGVFGLTQILPDRGASYLSFGCGHVRLYESPQTVEGLRHLFYSLDPTNVRSSHLLRNVAVGLFDLSGYTTLTRERGPAVARESVHRMVSAVRDASRQRGGQVADPVGDEVLVSFADPQQAVAATVETLETLHRLNAQSPGRLTRPRRIGFWTRRGRAESSLGGCREPSEAMSDHRPGRRDCDFSLAGRSAGRPQAVATRGGERKPERIRRGRSLPGAVGETITVKWALNACPTARRA